MNLSNHLNITRAIKGQSTNASSTGLAIDMQGYDGCMFLLTGSSNLHGSTMTIRCAGGPTTSAFVTYDTATCKADGTGADDSFDSKILALDVYKPLDRYIRCIIVGCTSDENQAYTVTAMQYAARRPGSSALNNSTTVTEVALAVSPSSS